MSSVDSENRSSLHPESIHPESIHSVHDQISSHATSSQLYSKTSSEVQVLDATPLDPEDLESHPRLVWYRRVQRRIAARYPRLSSKASRFLVYWRGPRPKLDLPSESIRGSIFERT